MASRLQKTLDVKPSVASVGSPTPPDTSLARQITATADIASEAILTKRKGDLETEITALGTEVFAASEGKDLEDATDRFKRLKKAKDQGILSDSMVNIEAEKILKQKIGANSIFAPELRKEAARILGFDPTGSEVMALFGKSGRSSPSRPMTAAQKRRANAEGLADVLGVDADNVERLIAKGEFAELQLKAASTAASLGQLDSNGVLTEAINGIDSYVTDANANLLTIINEGGVVDPAMAVAQIQQAKQTAWSNYRAVLGEAGITLDAAELSKQRKRFDEEFQPIIDMYGDSATLETILTRQKNSLTSAAAITGFGLFPALSAIGASPLGQAGVQEYLKLSTQISDPRQFELLKRQNPALAAIAGNLGQAQTAMTASYNRIMGIPVDPTAPQVEGLDDQVSRVLVKDAEDEGVRNTLLQSLQARGQSFKSLGDYSQKGVRARVTPKEIEYVKERWGVEFEPLTARLASALQSNPEVELSVVKGRLSASISVLNTTDVSNFGFSTAVPSAITTDLKRLNGMNALVQNGWAGDLNESAFGFLERTINKVSTLRADAGNSNEPDVVGQAIAAWQKTPSADNLEALRSVAPDLVAEAERRAAERGVSRDAK